MAPRRVARRRGPLRKSPSNPAPRRSFAAIASAAAPLVGSKRIDPLIVGAGASAGGLEAFTRLLKALPADAGLAFVLVQHLDPTHESALTELLSHATTMPVAEARDGMRLEANRVYVIPPNASLAVKGWRLKVAPRSQSRGVNLPVDFFFRSLAAEKGAWAVGVILSGTASDGTEGLRAIKAAGGLTFAQDDHSAKYSGMPRHAVAAGVVDFVQPPEGIARELARLGRLSPPAATVENLWPADEAGLGKIFTLLRTVTRVDFSLYKPTTLQRRLARRMQLHRLDSLADYARLLPQMPGEVEALYQDLLIHVTSFFREPAVFDVLKKSVFPSLLQNRPAGAPLRVWIPGCSTGEEAYSLAIALLEFPGVKAAGVPVQIFGTDISEPAIERARAGVYPADIAEDVSPARLRRFFVKRDGGWQIARAVRDLCVFARQDVTRDPPFSRLDLISCRNLLIYLGPAIQKKVIPTFHYALNPNGRLLLGGSETIGGFADLFALADRKHKLYTRKPGAHHLEFVLPRHPPLHAPAATAAPPPAAFDFQREADRVVLGKFQPAGVVVDEALDIVQFRGRTGPFLEAASGAASLNLLKMAREGLLVPLRDAVNEARRTRAPARRRGARVKSNGGFHPVNLEVTPLRPGPEGPVAGFLVLFEEANAAAAPQPAVPAEPPGRAARDRDLAQLRHELAATKEYLQSVITEQERLNEQLQSANEEILSSNEELQSTNEEMETAKEELQSTNEELTTVNDELHTRNVELTAAGSDLANLLNSVQIPIVMLTGDLRIRRFTPPAERVLNLIPSDVGRPLTDLRLNIVVPELERHIAEVLDTLAPKELEVQDREGRWHALRLRPYRTLEDKIDGVIMALVDIDAVRRALAQSQEARRLAEAVIETVRQPLLVLDGELRVKSANTAFYGLFQTRPAETENRFVYGLGAAQWDIPKLRELLEDILPKNSRFENFEVNAEFSGVGRKKLVLDARRVVDESRRAQWILLAMEERP